MSDGMITSTQCRMARAGLRWGVIELAAAAKISTNTVTRFERGCKKVTGQTAAKIKRALNGAGVVFLRDGRGVTLVEQTTEKESSDGG